MTDEIEEETDELPPKKKGKSAKKDKGSRLNTHQTNTVPTGSDKPPKLMKDKTAKPSVRNAIQEARQNKEDEVEALSDATVRPHGNSMPTLKMFVLSHPLTHAHAQRNDPFLLFSEQQRDYSLQSWCHQEMGRQNGRLHSRNKIQVCQLHLLYATSK